MSAALPWILISIAILLVLCGIVALILAKQGKRRGPDYYAFFIMGLIWLPAGIALGNYALAGFGVVLMALGLANKSKWKENRRNWQEIDDDEKRLIAIAMIVLVVLFVLGALFFLLFA